MIDFRPSKDILKVIPFNSNRKKMISAVYDTQSSSLMIYVKGASEIVLDHCTKIIDADGKVRVLEKAERDSLVKEVIDNYASKIKKKYLD